MRTLQSYSEEIQKNAGAPDALTDLLVEMSSHYAFLTEKHINLKLAKAVFENKAKFSYTENGEDKEREKPLSDTSVQSKFRLTEVGKEEYRVKRTVQALEKLMKSLQTILYSFKQ